MVNNKVVQKLKSGKPALGVLSPTTDPVICEYIGLSGFDFYMIDGEHGAITLSEVATLVRACECVDMPAWARIRAIDEKLILQFLDTGISGVMMPSVKSVDDVHRLVAATKYPPIGHRGLGPVRAADYMMGALSQEAYIAHANEHILILPQIEDMACVAALDEMLQIEGVDGFIIGPRDLAMSMGFYDGPAHPQVKQVIDEIIQKVVVSGKLIGTVAASADQANALIDQGVHIILNSVQGLLMQASKGFLSGIKH
jgi:4-hydroxy-2-oxoheptanedioate aldolase